MKKLLLTTILVLGFAYSAAALPNSGEYMFKLGGNDSNTDPSIIETEMESWFLDIKNVTRDIDLEFYSKVDAPDLSTAIMTVTYESDNMSGTWATQEAIEFYSVKAATEFAFYWVDGGSAIGTWNTEDLLTPNGKNIPTISHLSTWNPVDGQGPGPGPDPVPEPGTIVLLGLGLVGLAGYRKYKK